MDIKANWRSSILMFIHQARSNMYDDNSYRKRSYKHLVKYYDLLQNWQKPPFTVEIYRTIRYEMLF